MNKINNIEITLKDQGYKLTGQRRIIIDVFEECPAHYTAQEVFEKVKTQNPNINFSTVYRNLELLCKIGVINKLNISSKISHFELAHNCTEDQCHPHFTCINCGDTYCLTEVAIPMTKSLRKGFVIGHQRIQLEGLCPRCNLNQ